MPNEMATLRAQMSANLPLHIAGQGVLDAMPDTAAGIAALFRKEGVTGRRSNPGDCPGARYLRRMFSTMGVTNILVGATSIFISDGMKGFPSTNDGHSVYAVLKTPKGLESFLRGFDAGVYIGEFECVPSFLLNDLDLVNA